MRVLLVTSRHPVPPWRGNQVRTTEWLSALSDLDLHLVCPPAGGGMAGAPQARVTNYRLSPVGQAIGLLRAAVSGRPLQEGLYDSGAARRTVADAVQSWSPDVVVIQMVRCAWAAEAVRRVAPGVPIVFDAIDAMGLHFDRAARSAAAWLAGLLRNEGARCRRRERWLSGAAGITVAVSARDLAELSVPPGKGRSIPVAGRETAIRESPRSGPVALLSGNLGYRPTVEGAVWFAREVWPRVLARVPDARWVLAGARPAAAVRRLSRLRGVEVHADVPDLGTFISSARVAVAPMSSGSGVPMKVLESMAAGVPAVVHPWAAEGLVENAAAAVVVADGAEAWAEALVRLLSDVAGARDLGERGRLAWRRHYHPDVVAQQIRDVIAEAAGVNVATLKR
jgi:glycosyltransferase involved in cell wall biosynthesis